MNREYELKMMIDELYNMAYSSLKQEEHNLKQRQIDLLTLSPEKENTATAISYEAMWIERNSQQWARHMERLFKLREDIFKAIEEDDNQWLRK